MPKSGSAALARKYTGSKVIRLLHSPAGSTQPKLGFRGRGCNDYFQQGIFDTAIDPDRRRIERDLNYEGAELAKP
jgi:hypothetical protein